MRDNDPVNQHGCEINADTPLGDMRATLKAGEPWTALVEQLFASAISLSQRAELVTQSVRVFRLNGNARPA